MEIRELIEGLQVLEAYCDPESSDKFLCLLEDEIVTGPSFADKISEAHLLQLEKLGWRFDEIQECWRKFT